MKVVTIICLISLFRGSELNRSTKLKFLQWKKIQGKTYQSAFQTIEAFKNFVDTQKKIEEHNKKFKLGLSNFQQSANKFADLSLDDMKKVSTGFHPPPMQMSQRSMSVVAPNSIPKGPKSFDWRKKNSVTPVKDQGFFCNACWAFSAIAALESFYLIQYGINASFSEQQLIDCNRNKRTGNWGCQGGSQGSAYVYIENNGIQTTESYPYKEDLPHSDIYPCSANSSDNVGVITDYFRIRPGDEETLKDAVAFFGPFSAAFDGSLESFMYYEKGIYEDPLCDKKSLSHSALIVGYGTEERNGTEVDYWLCKNSWSTDWGEQGYFRILRGSNMCGITNYLISPKREELDQL